jgi:uncharacterized membrane protein
VRYTKHKLALFFTVQTVGVAAMIIICKVGLHPDCPLLDEECARPAAASVLLAVGMIVGELVVVAAALRNDLPVWHALVGLGAISFVTAFICGLAAFGANPPRDVASALAVWHVVLGAILLVAGVAAGAWNLTDKLRRSDDMLAEDRESSAMWPLD